MQKYGLKRNKQRYKCSQCKHQFLITYQHKKKLAQQYEEYAVGKRTLQELAVQTGKSIRTLQREFDQLIIEPYFILLATEPVNLIVDATFFGRTDGVLVFRANKRNIYWRFIQSETIKELSQGLDVLNNLGYRFKSITLDGRKGMIKLFEARYPGIPIQLCQFHQAQIIRRYTTNNPKTTCGKELKLVMHSITETSQEVFQSLIKICYEKYEDFLKERNDNGQFKHRQLRSAFRSLKSNLPYLFAYKNYPDLKIPNTTNSCDGSFAHWKQKLKIHRGLREHRRNKMINFLLGFS